MCFQIILSCSQTSERELYVLESIKRRMLITDIRRDFSLYSILDLTAIMSDIFRLADARTNYNEKKFSGFL